MTISDSSRENAAILTGFNSEQPRPTSVLCARVVPTLIVYIISLSHTGVRRSEESSCLRCRWVDGTCASSSDASALYIHDSANVVQ